MPCLVMDDINIVVCEVFYDVICGDGSVVEVKTWISGKDVDDCANKWRKHDPAPRGFRIQKIDIPSFL